MANKILVERLSASVGEISTSVAVLGLQPMSTDDMHMRSQRFLSLIGEREQIALDRYDWQRRDDHSLLHLADGARAVMYHASGATKYVSGLKPFDNLFEKMPDQESLVRAVQDAAQRLAISEWAGPGGELKFEKLFRSTAQGMDRNGRLSQEVLCRIIGAYRHYVEGIPVLGAAGVALKLGGDGSLDSMSLQVRPSGATTIEKARVLDPQLAATQINAELASRLGVPVDGIATELIEQMSMQYGYLNLGKRKAQRVLAPAFMAQVVLRHKEERQAYTIAVPATEKSYLPVCQCGRESLPTASRLTAATTPTSTVTPTRLAATRKR